MFRTQRAFAALQRRTFVSTVLLTRNWENETVNVLKNEAKKRGLLQTGNKSTLVGRLKQHERQHLVESHPTPVAPQQTRLASTATEVPGVPSSSQPSPIPSSYPKEFLDVKLPDISRPTPERPVEVPFLPDFWDSSIVKAQNAAPVAPTTDTPKVLAVAGAATHHGGGPSHNLYSPSAAEPWADAPPSGESESADSSGGWALLGILAGSWLVAGFFKPSSAFASKEEATQSQHH